MADLYTKGQIITPQLGSVKTFNYENANKLMSRGKQEQQAGEKRIEQVQDIYNKQLNITAQGSLSALANNPALSSNPQAMATEIDKVVGKMSSEIPDNETKVNFLMNMELKKQSYINNAQANFNKEQVQKEKETSFINIDNDYQLASLSISNMLNGSATVDDLINYDNSVKNYANTLKSQNSLGKSNFSPYQQYKMTEQLREMHRKAVLNHINQLPPDECESFLNDVINDTATVSAGIDKDGVLQQRNINDFLTAEDKDYIKGRARSILNRYNKKVKELKGSESGDPETMIDEESVFQKEKVQDFTKIDLERQLKPFTKEKIIDAKDEAFGIMGMRSQIIDEYQKGNLSEKDYNSLMVKTISPLINRVDDVKPEWYKWFDDQAFFEGARVLNTIDGATQQEKAYLYTNMYQYMNRQGIDPYSDDPADIERMKEFAVAQKKMYAEKKNTNAIGTDVAMVLTGTGVLIDHAKPEKEQEATNLNYKILLTKDGQKAYKVLKNYNTGEYDEGSVKIKLFK